jgi:acetyltransferase
MAADFLDPQERAPLTLRSGRQVSVRQITPDDREKLVAFYYSLSVETQEMRFFGHNHPRDVVENEATRLTQVSPKYNLILLALAADEAPERVIGTARYVCDRDDSTTAEIAIVIQDAYQGDGLGRQLMELLIRAGRARGLKHLRAVWRSQNRALQRLILGSGLAHTSSTSQGETTTLLEIPE